MVDLDFAVEKAETLPGALTPQLVLKLRIDQRERPGVRAAVHAIALRCQVNIEPIGRKYGPEEQEKLRDLFGEPARWGQTLRTMLWTQTSAMVPAFNGSTVVDLPLPCTFDFNVAATKYFHALDDGLVPLDLLFSGTIFYLGEAGRLQIGQIPWEKEARFKLPVETWKKMMSQYYPNSTWLCLANDVFDQLYRFKITSGSPTWEQAFEKLLGERESAARGDRS